MKKFIAIFLSLGILVSFNTYALAVNQTAPSNLASQEDAITFFQNEVDNDSFGGLYYEDDLLVVNLVSDSDNIFSNLYSYSPNIEYRYVKYALSYLEDVKDFLAESMREYCIWAIDANEETNLVDIYLSSYNDNLITLITNEVLTCFGSADMLNFIDYSSYIIKSTVAYEQPNYNPASLAINYSLSIPIKIGGGYYTLGPIKNEGTAFSAGHGFSGIQSVYSALLPTAQYIGTAISNYGGSSGDWSKITAAGATFTGEVNFSDAVKGQKIYMIGSVSGKTSGKVTATNVTVDALAPYKPLTGMYAGDYFCQLGDSGAGLYNSSTTVSYGIQSSALFNPYDDSWAGTSYFTPTNKFC